MVRCRVRYSDIIEGKTRKYFDDKTSARKHINVMLRRFPYATMYLEVPTKMQGWKPDSSYRITFQKSRKGRIEKQ